MIYCLYIQNDCELPACRCSGEDPTYDPDYDVKKYPQVESSIDSKTDLQISDSQSSPDPIYDPDGNVQIYVQVDNQIERQTDSQIYISDCQSSPDDPTNDPDGNVIKNPQVYR